ncbi:MAG: phosphatidylglycerophosphatase A, partial [Pseudomonadota bacterium]
AAIGGWVGWVLGFFAFRAFDVAKPGPIGWLDGNVKAGWGIMLDDVAAGIAAAAATLAILIAGRYGFAA